MIAEKPSWVKHGGTQIFSVDIQPGGLRFATGGGDQKVRIWNMKCVSRKLQAGDSAANLLATLRDHFGSVNCVRWAKHGRYIASGSDDQVILIHERKPGSGTTEFGSGEPPDVENWKVSLTLRGHTADVVDLNWSPDDSTLASASLDNTVHIWDTSNGICTAVLRGHSSLVKGVAWDPINSFIASQSDDKTVIIWRTSDWSLAHRTDGHWAKSLGSTFFRRLDWSPCGHFITTTHGFQKPRHSAPVLERGEWSATFDFLGHNAPIIVAKFNHSMFRKNSSIPYDSKASSAGWSNGSSKAEGKDLLPYNVIAIGSQDRNITVWTTASPRPLFVAKHFFSQSVVDLTWSPDGYSLFACSLDGTIATFHFDVNEIGHKLTEAELYDLKKNRYGDTRGQQGSLAETPAQLLLEAASLKHSPLKKKISSIIPETQASLKQTPLRKMNPVTPETQSSKPSTDLVVTTQNNGNHAQGDDKTEDSATDESKKLEPARVSSPVKQREYTRPDGRKRIIPEAVGSTANQKKTRIVSQSKVLEVSRKSLDGIGGISDCGAINGYFRKSTENSLLKESHGVTARATITESLVVEKVPESSGKEGTKNVEEIGRVACGGNLSIKVYDNRQGEDKIPFCLEAHSKERAVTDIIGTGNSQTIKETEILCTKGSEKLWSDRISGKVTVLAGNLNFWAVGCEDGCLQVYTKCGRRAMPAMMLGSAAVFIDCDEIWRLLLVTKNGSLYVWDLFTRKCLLHDSLSSLIPTDQKLNPKATGTMKVISVKLSKCGSPLAVLVTRHAYLFDTSLLCWLRVADDSFSASNFGSSWNFGSGEGGELAALQVDVRKFVARKPGWGRVTDDGVQTRAHLEAQMASAMALKSPNEYRQSLLSYIRFLTREADEPRLREVCESFLGPPMGMVESESSDTKPSAWEPSVLGADKHKLLREDVLPAMASNRKVQRLLNEFIDLLSEYEAETNVIKENHTFPAPQPLADKMDSEPVSSKLDSDHSTKATQTSLIAPAADAVDPDHSTKATQTSLIAPAVDAVDPTPQTDDRMDTTPQTTNQAPEDPVQLQTAPLAPSEEMDINPPNSDHMDTVGKADGDLPSPVQQNNEC